MCIPFHWILLQVTVVVGDPIYFEDLLVSKDNTQDASRGTLYDAVSSRIGQRLRELKVQAERLTLEQKFEVQQYDERQAYRIWQQVDWEAFGMENVMSSDGEASKQVLLNQPDRFLEQPPQPNSGHQTIRVGFSYEGGIMSRVRCYVNPSEFMGFAARGLFINDQSFNENIQEAAPVKAWKRFVSARSAGESRFCIHEAHPVKAWKQFMNERLSDEGRFSIQDARPIKAWKQFFEGNFCNKLCDNSV